MSRILAIDYGTSRCGIAVTDPSQMIATALTTVATATLLDFIKSYLQIEAVEMVVFGEPRTRDGQPHFLEPAIRELIKKLKGTYPDLKIERMDERLTSLMAQHTILASGIGKKKRSDKTLLDKVSAVIILQSFLEKRNSSRL